MHLDETADPVVCKWNSGIDNCSVYDKADECSKCDDGYFIALVNKCCKIGQKLVGANCVEGEKNCIMYDNDAKCTTCISGHYISVDTNSVPHCCPDGTYVHLYNNIPVCYPIKRLFEECKFFDMTKFECATPTDTAAEYLHSHAVSNFYEYYDPFAPADVFITQPSCKSLNDQLVCTLCDDNYYLSNQNCCPFGRYWDVQRQ